MKTLETKRLILRTFQEDDAFDVFQYAKVPDIGPNAGWEPHQNQETSLKIVQKFIKEDDVWAIVDKESNKVIGSLGLHHDNFRSPKDVRMLGYVLSKDYWGRGLMTEAVMCVLNYAFSELNLKLISVYHFANNYRSKRVIEKCGFTYEGTLRHARTMIDGSIQDDCLYSLYKREWENINKK